ncbi:DUF2199 domain-containing protein [Lysobacter niastensis]|uniref:DUF2199 domain-containing protein n=1 Tax=Lysobacter niastensis TaxID=380629 RepID=UPI003D2F9272
MTHQCSVCGTQHDEWPPGYGFSQPDAVWELSPEQKNGRVMETPDFCCIDGTRCFVLANFQIPVSGLESPWILSLWAEISQSDFSQFLGSYAVAVSGSVDGILCNHLGAFPGAVGSSVKVHLGSSKARPALEATDLNSDIGRAQHTGLSQQELHDKLAAMGYDWES